MLKFELCEFNKSKGIQVIGEIKISLQEIFEKSLKTLPLQKNNIHIGQLEIIKLKKISRNTFLNYIYAGTEISLIVAIDFNRSNKDYHLPDSLHNLFEGIYIYCD